MGMILNHLVCLTQLFNFKNQITEQQQPGGLDLRHGPDLKELPQGFISITDPALETTETVVKLVIPKKRTVGDLGLSFPRERVKYCARWEGGGAINVRVVKCFNKTIK